MAHQFGYLIEGRHISGKIFRQEFVVIAMDEDEAHEELQKCLDYYNLVAEWKIVARKDVTDFQGRGDFDYETKGPFTVFDPTFHFVEDDAGKP